MSAIKSITDTNKTVRTDLWGDRRSNPLFNPNCKASEKITSENCKNGKEVAYVELLPREGIE